MKSRSIVLASALLALTSRAAADGCPSGACRADWGICATDNMKAIVIANRAHAPDATGVNCRWIAYRDGVQIAAGTYPLHVFRQGPARPGQAVTNPVPPVVGRVGARGGEMSLRVRLEKSDSEGGKPVILAENAVDFSPVPVPFPPSPAPPGLKRHGQTWSFSANGVSYVFDRRTAALSSIVTGRWFGKEWLKEPVSFVATSDLQVVRATLTDPVVTNGAASFTGIVRWAPAGKTGAAADREAFDIVSRWTVRGDGRLLWQSEIRPDGTARPCDRVGFRFLFDAERPLLQYFGKAPGDVFAGRGQTDMQGSAEFRAADLRACAFDAGWDHLSFASAGTRFTADAGRGIAATEFVLSVPTGGSVSGGRDLPLAFVIAPDKRLAAWAAADGDLPGTERRSLAATTRIEYDSGAAAGYPRVTLADLGRVVTATGVRLGSAGTPRVKDFAFETSCDRVKWSREAEGTLADAAGKREFTFTSPVTMRYWRLAANGGYGNSKGAATAAVEVVTE